MSIYILKEKTRTNLRANEFRTSFWGRLGEWFEETKNQDRNTKIGKY